MATGPTRTCVVCRKPAGKSELVRVVLGAEGLELDAENRLPGRGAYVHRTKGCGGAKGLAERIFYSISKGSSKKESSGALTGEMKKKFEAVQLQMFGESTGGEVKPARMRKFRLICL